MIKNILLDMDGVISDFLSSALQRLNEKYGKNITPEEYASYGVFDMEKVYNISVEDFWSTIETPDFWIGLNPMPWATRLLETLQKIAPVTIASSPSKNPFCAADKALWVKKHLGLENNNLMLGSRKYLMANPNNLLIDDYNKNTSKFIQHGGHAILIPSSWNTPHLSYDIIMDHITKGLEHISERHIKTNLVSRDRHGGMIVIPDGKGKEF